MKEIQLLAVIEVPEDKKVLCQSEKCGRPVYKSIHIVKINGNLKVIGSECFKKHMGKNRSVNSKPLYGSSAGIRLSEDERDLLLMNTEKLITEIQAKYNSDEKTELADDINYSTFSDEELRILAITMTKKDFRQNKGLNPELPGWVGWVKSDAASLYKKLKELSVKRSSNDN